MDDLVTWLRGVLDEDEQLARDNEGEMDVRWYRVNSLTPASVLADIKAKRAILDRYERLASDPTFNQPTTYGQQIAYEAAIACIASAYRDRDGYREEWKP